MTEASDDKSDRLIALVTSRLDEDVAALDPRVTARLLAARREVLAQGRAPAPRLAWASGLAAASVALLAVTLWLWRPAGDTAAPHLEDVELIASAEDLELYEDLEFYAWLADAEPTN